MHYASKRFLFQPSGEARPFNPDVVLPVPISCAVTLTMRQVERAGAKVLILVADRLGIFCWETHSCQGGIKAKEDAAVGIIMDSRRPIGWRRLAHKRKGPWLRGPGVSKAPTIDAT